MEPNHRNFNDVGTGTLNGSVSRCPSGAGRRSRRGEVYRD